MAAVATSSAPSTSSAHSTGRVPRSSGQLRARSVEPRLKPFDDKDLPTGYFSSAKAAAAWTARQYSENTQGCASVVKIPTCFVGALFTLVCALLGVVYFLIRVLTCTDYYEQLEELRIDIAGDINRSGFASSKNLHDYLEMTGLEELPEDFVGRVRTLSIFDCSQSELLSHQFPNLRSLYFTKCNFKNYLSEWRSMVPNPEGLMHLHLQGYCESSIEDYALGQMLERCENLRTLDLRGHYRLTRESLATIARCCPKLTTLSLPQHLKDHINDLRCPRLCEVLFDSERVRSSDHLVISYAERRDGTQPFTLRSSEGNSENIERIIQERVRERAQRQGWMG